MKIKVSEATPKQIDWMVAKCAGVKVRWSAPHDQLLDISQPYAVWCPHRSWAQGGPIIERESIQVTPGWSAIVHKNIFLDGLECFMQGPTPLIAAMRCYVASKLGEEVDVPDNLI